MLSRTSLRTASSAVKASSKIVSFPSSGISKIGARRNAGHGPGPWNEPTGWLFGEKVSFYWNERDKQVECRGKGLGREGEDES